jgi:hypothetical protein
VQLQQVWGDADVSLHLVHQIDRQQPLFVFNPASGMVHPIYQGVLQLGGTYAHVIDHLILKVEGAYRRFDRVSAQGPLGAPPRRDHLLLSLGTEYVLGLGVGSETSLIAEGQALIPTVAHYHEALEPLFQHDVMIGARLAFNDAGDTLYARTPTGLWAVAAPPAVSPPRRLAASDSVRADSSLTVYLGEPKFARVGACTNAAGALCAFPPSGEVIWQEGGTDPVRWGSDSAGFLVGDRMIVRSGGGGRSREVRWTRVPPGLRHPTFAPPFRSP